MKIKNFLLSFFVISSLAISGVSAFVINPDGSVSYTEDEKNIINFVFVNSPLYPSEPCMIMSTLFPNAPIPNTPVVQCLHDLINSKHIPLDIASNMLNGYFKGLWGDYESDLMVYGLKSHFNAIGASIKFSSYKLLMYNNFNPQNLFLSKFCLDQVFENLKALEIANSYIASLEEIFRSRLEDKQQELNAYWGNGKDKPENCTQEVFNKMNDNYNRASKILDALVGFKSDIDGLVTERRLDATRTFEDYNKMLNANTTNNAPNMPIQ